MSGFSQGFPREGGPPEDVSLKVFPNLKRTHEYGNLHVHEGFSFMRMWEQIEIGSLIPWYDALGFFSWGRSLKIHRKKRRVICTWTPSIKCVCIEMTSAKSSKGSL